MANVRVEENVVIHQVEGRALRVDIFRPANQPGPVQGLLFLPGGGWQTADRPPSKSATVCGWRRAGTSASPGNTA